jgi:hypothetical protein
VYGAGFATRRTAFSTERAQAPVGAGAGGESWQVAIGAPQVDSFGHGGAAACIDRLSQQSNTAAESTADWTGITALIARALGLDPTLLYVAGIFLGAVAANPFLIHIYGQALVQQALKKAIIKAVIAALDNALGPDAEPGTPTPSQPEERPPGPRPGGWDPSPGW